MTKWKLLLPVALSAAIFAPHIAAAAGYAFDQVWQANLARVMDGVTGLAGCFY